MKSKARGITLDECARYFDDPVGYVEHVLGFASLDPGQCDVLEAISKYDRVGLKAGNGWGKSFVLACAGLWFFDTRPFSRVPTTSGSFRQVKRSLWAEVHGLARGSALKDTYNLNRTDIERKGHEQEWYIAGFSTDNAAQAEGWHAKHLLYILDEARAIEDEVWKAAFKAATTPGAKILAGSIPGEAAGQFYRIFTNLRKSWKTFSFPTGKFKHGRYKALYPDRVSQKSIDEKLHDEGESSPFFQTSVLAKFSNTTEDSIVPLKDFVKAKENNALETTGGITYGGDVARFGRDKSCICTRQGGRILSFKEKGLMDTQSTATWFELEAQGQPICVDEIGVGAGVVDAMRKSEGNQCIAVNVARAASDPEKFSNLRAELYWKVRLKFERGEIDLSALDAKTLDKLQSQLCSMGYSFKKGKLLVESKEDMKKRGLPSPDLADSLMLSFFADGSGLLSGMIQGHEGVTGGMLGQEWSSTQTEQSTEPEPSYDEVRAGRPRPENEGMGISYAAHGDW